MKNMTLNSSHTAEVIQIQYCDICPGRARYEVTFTTGVLYFCGHHFNAKKQDLEKALLLVKPINQPQSIN